MEFIVYPASGCSSSCRGCSRTAAWRARPAAECRTSTCRSTRTRAEGDWPESKVNSSKNNFYCFHIFKSIHRKITFNVFISLSQFIEK